MRAFSIGYHDILENEAARAILPKHSLVYRLDRLDFRRHLWAIHAADGAVGSIAGFRRWNGETPVFLTFDDGAESSHSCVADELERHGWHGHFFITTDWIRRPGFMNESQIRELHAGGHVIGSHSCSHPSRMSQLDRSALLREWGESCARLADIIGAPIRVASVPDGYYKRAVASAAAEAGIEVLFTSEPRADAQIVDGCLVLGRYAIQRGMTPEVSGSLAAGRIAPRWRQSVAWNARKAVKSVSGEYYFTIRKFLLSHF